MLDPDRPPFQSNNDGIKMELQPGFNLMPTGIFRIRNGQVGYCSTPDGSQCFEYMDYFVIPTQSLFK